MKVDFFLEHEIGIYPGKLSSNLRQVAKKLGLAEGWTPEEAALALALLACFVDVRREGVQSLDDVFTARTSTGLMDRLGFRLVDWQDAGKVREDRMELIDDFKAKIYQAAFGRTLEAGIREFADRHSALAMKRGAEIVVKDQIYSGLLGEMGKADQNTGGSE